MDLQTRKIEFIQEFLKIQSEEVITQFERLLKEGTKKKATKFIPMTPEELELRISKSESDFEAKRYKTSVEVFSKYNL